MKLKKSKLLILSFFVFLFFLTGCGGSAKKDMKAASLEVERNAPKLEEESRVKERLYEQYREWKGVRYRIGGRSKSGIDCSGFVQRTFIDKFDRLLPRSTREQAELGEKVRKSRLRPGDLLFFKTGIRVRHVGIYLEDGKFLHASTSRGVMISRLTNVYWKKKYWKARRVEW